LRFRGGASLESPRFEWRLDPGTTTEEFAQLKALKKVNANFGARTVRVATWSGVVYIAFVVDTVSRTADPPMSDIWRPSGEHCRLSP
jgi:hypothetical protein